MSLKPKKCLICGETFVPTSGRQVKCPECRNKKIECVLCGKLHKPAFTNSDGEYICSTCYRNSKLLEYYNSLPDNKKPDWKYVENIIGIHRKREIECWKTGKSYFNDFISVVQKRASGRCELTGKKSSNFEVHHLNGYNWCIEERVDPDNAVCIGKAVHKAFHRIYGYGDNTMEQWLEFASNYEKQPVTLDDWL